MRSSPLYALLCLQLAFAPAALAAQPTWEAKRAHMASEIAEALKSLNELDRTGPLCSDNYLKSQCPSIMPPPKQTFVEAARKNLKALEKEVAGIAPDAKIADQPFDPKKLPEVDGCAGAGTSTAADAAKRKAAADKMNTVFAKVSSALSGDLGKLFDSSGFKAKASACVDASNLNFMKKAFVKANLPAYPHGALDYMWTPDSAHKSCPRSGVDTFRKLTGTTKGDGKAQLARLASNGKEYAANLAKSSADLAKHTKVAGKIDCKSADQTQVAAKPADDKKPDISGKKEEKPGTPASTETDPKPGKVDTAEKPATEPAPVATETPDTGQQPPADTAGNQVDPAPVDTTAETNPPIPEPSPLTPENPPAEQKAGLSKGQIIGGLAILGVGAGAAYLIFSDKDKNDKGGDVKIPSRNPAATNTKTATATKTGTSTKTSTGTKTSTSTGPTSTVPYTGTLTSTTVGTETETASETGTQTSTSTSTSTATRE